MIKNITLLSPVIASSLDADVTMTPFLSKIRQKCLLLQNLVEKNHVF